MMPYMRLPGPSALRCGMLIGRISSAKNNLITPEVYMGNNEIRTKDMATRRPQLGEIYSQYVKRCKKFGAMDFDDLLLITNLLLRTLGEDWRSPVAALRDVKKQVPHDLFVAIIHADEKMVSSILEQCPGIDVHCPIPMPGC